MNIKTNVQNRDFFIKSLVFSSIILLSMDTMYKSINGITYLTRKNCILYTSLPRWAFFFYEYFVELSLLVIVGIFIAALLEKYFTRLNKLIPRTPITAFVYASVIPLCSCSAVPLVQTMNEKIPFRAVITFVVAAPLLNPYIVMLSFTVLGIEYAVLRILCSLILAVVTGYITEYFYTRMKDKKIGLLSGCNQGDGCTMMKTNIYDTTFYILKKVFPYIIVAGVLGVIVEVAVPSNMLRHYDLGDHVLGTVLVVLIGVPVYFCNGADVLFLQPLIKLNHLPLGTAMAFSLTSTSVCITSLVLLIRFVGKKLTFIILMNIIIITFVLSFLIHFL